MFLAFAFCTGTPHPHPEAPGTEAFALDGLRVSFFSLFLFSFVFFFLRQTPLRFNDISWSLLDNCHKMKFQLRAKSGDKRKITEPERRKVK